jgi:hypothetical protein
MVSENLPVFDVDLAFTLLQMSAIIYEWFVPTLFLRVDGLEIPISSDLLGIFMMQRSVG